MKWFEYKAQVDALHAPEDLKARLRAMQSEEAPPAAEEATEDWRSGPNLQADGAALASPSGRGGTAQAVTERAERTETPPAADAATGTASPTCHSEEAAGRRGNPSPTSAPAPAPARAARPIRPRWAWNKAAGMAACFVGGVVCTAVVGGGLLLGTFAMGGSASAFDSAAGVPSENKSSAQSSTATAESARDLYGYVTDDLNGSVGLTDALLDEPAARNAEAGSADPAEQKAEADTARKIIYTADLTLEATDYDAALAALADALSAAGGYVQHSENYNYGTDNRRVNYTLRVPAASYRSFLAAAEGVGSLTDKTEDSQDITAQYVDVAARIETLQAQRTRLQQLSAQAESLTDLLEIEEKLSEVQYQLESWQRQLAVYDDQVDYCTVTVTVREVTVYTPVQPTALERMTTALTRGFADFADTLFDGVLWLLRNLSWLAMLTAAALLVRRAWRKRRQQNG